MGFKFNPFTGNLDLVDTTTAAGSNTQVQFNDGGSLAGDSGLTFNKTTNALTVGASTVDGGQAKVFGDINLDDGGSFTTTVQCVTPTQNRTISFPDATGTVALVAGSSGQLVYNNAGAQAGAAGSVVDSSGNVTIGGLATLAGSPSANNTSGVLINGTWRTGASSNNPQLLLNPSGTTLSTTWSTSGTGIGVNAPASFGGNLLDLQVNGTSQFRLNNEGALTMPNDFIFTRGASVSLRAGPTYLGIASELRFSNNNASSGDVTLARDAANTLAQRNGTNAQTFRVYNTYTSGTNYELGKLEWSSNVFRIGTEKGSAGGTARALELQTDGVTRVTIGATNGHLTGSNDVYCAASAFIGCNGRSIFSSPSDGVMRITNYGVNDFNRLQFGGTTASFPALKRNAAVLETKLADDSAYAQHAASVFQAATAHTVGTLPGTPAVGMIARVTDATAPAVGSPVSGGGAAAALVWYNGSQWTVIGV
jgi:hypothetical protein